MFASFANRIISCIFLPPVVKNHRQNIYDFIFALLNMLRPKNAQMMSFFGAWLYSIHTCSFTELVIAETKIYCWLEKKTKAVT